MNNMLQSVKNLEHRFVQQESELQPIKDKRAT
jgi:hypothetical protein